MSNSRMIMNFAEYLNDVSSREAIHTYYTDQAVRIHEDVFNHVVILLTMCINKEIKIALSEDDEVSVEEYPGRLKEIYSEILKNFNHLNTNIVPVLEISEQDKKSFQEYLNYMVQCLLSGIQYIEKKEGDEWHKCDETNEWNTRYRREERIRDYMKGMISKQRKYTKFTIQKHIEIPYMYVLAWDLPTLFRTFNDSHNIIDDTSYLSNLRSNTSVALKYISDNLLDILIDGEQTDGERFEEEEPNEGMTAIKYFKQVSYENLLPTIIVREKTDYNHDLHDPSAWVHARKNHILPLIKKEVLRKMPLLPMETDQNIFEPLKSMKMMIALMQEENKTKDYLASDITYLKDIMVQMCEKILDWLWQPHAEFTRIENDEAQQYLISIIKAANNVPRKNSTENREDHIKKIVNIVAKEWDAKQLTNINVEDDDPESYVVYAYFSVLKLTRNWNEHNLISNFSISFAVFIFMISVRYLVDINKLDMECHREYLYMEAKLFKFFGEEKIEYEKMELDKLSDEYESMYHTVNNEAFENEHKDWAKNFPKEDKIDPHQVLNAAGHKNSLIKNKMSEDELFLAFWMSLHFGKAHNSAQTIEHTRDLNLIELLEYTYKYQRKSFLVNAR